MKEYYAGRKGLIKQKLKLDLYELNSYFYQLYSYFNNKQYFNVARKGVWDKKDKYSDLEQIVEPTFVPSEEVFFSTILQNSEVLPIHQHYQEYTEEIVFSIIEILYDHISIFDYKSKKIDKELPQLEYAEQINNILRFYGEGFYLEPKNGFIMKIPNEALMQQLSYSGDEMKDDVYERLCSATRTYYRFDSDLEMKKKAITTLGDIYESSREEVKELFNSEYGMSKNSHDKLIFGILNEFNIRHDRADQKGDYSKEIWYDWMMQYYTSVIIAYYRLLSKYSK